jgi:hypothetical protein
LREKADIRQVRMFEIKLSQGAKPGKGGLLPAVKVSAQVADIRGIPEGLAGSGFVEPGAGVDVTSEGALFQVSLDGAAGFQSPAGGAFLQCPFFFFVISDQNVEYFGLNGV